MTGLISEIVEHASDSSYDITALLRKALIASSRLQIPEMRGWLQNELDGYRDKSDIPSYREVTGKPYYQDDRGRWEPMYFESERVEKAFSTKKVFQSVSELDKIVKGHTPESSIGIRFTGTTLIKIREKLGYPTDATLDLPITEIIRILTAVRNEVLRWALDLEEKGVTGEGMNFSDKEKDIAKESLVTNNYINNHFGAVSNSPIQQGTTHSTQNSSYKNDLESLPEIITAIRSSAEDGNLSTEEKTQLVAYADTLEAQTKFSNPNPVIVNESIKSARNIIEGITGSIAATHFMNMITTLLP